MKTPPTPPTPPPLHPPRTVAITEEELATLAAAMAAAGRDLVSIYRCTGIYLNPCSRTDAEL